MKEGRNLMSLFNYQNDLYPSVRMRYDNIAAKFGYRPYDLRSAK
ncbi:hypothetical protein HMPREF9412_2544 [Paenibacillus sp. HGF5]|nr:hypothetical protein HMPREF9412_2544 [Paenibacillus sp. HGF5]